MLVIAYVLILGVIVCAESPPKMRPDYRGIGLLLAIGKPHFDLQLSKHATRVLPRL